MLNSQNNNSREWLKVSDLEAGMRIAVPKAECFAMHNNVLADDSVLEADGTRDRGTKAQDSMLANPEAKSAAGSDVMWDEIEEIKEVGQEKVYDIEVEGTHNFVAGHLIDKETGKQFTEEEETEYLEGKTEKEAWYGSIFAHNTYLAGNVGIGTSTPAHMLHIGSNAAGGDVMIGKGALCVDDNDLCAGALADGTVYAVGAYSQTADYAEYFYSDDLDLVPGEVVCVDVTQDNAVKRCLNPADGNVMGIVSTNPAFTGNATDETMNNPNYKIIGMLGQLPTKVSSENGEIRPGDSLTSASTLGYAMRANAGDPTVGVALEGFSRQGGLVAPSGGVADSDSADSSESDSAAGSDQAATGMINVLVSRRNKSLTVEQVEQEVVDRIAEMEIEDEVAILVSSAVEGYNFDPVVSNIIGEELVALEGSFGLQFETLADSIALSVALQNKGFNELTNLINENKLSFIQELENEVAINTDLTVIGDLELSGTLVLDGSIELVLGASIVRGSSDPPRAFKVLEDGTVSAYRDFVLSGTTKIHDIAGITDLFILDASSEDMPQRAIVASTSAEYYIFDAKDASLFSRIEKTASTTLDLFSPPIQLTTYNLQLLPPVPGQEDDFGAIWLEGDIVATSTAHNLFAAASGRQLWIETQEQSIKDVLAVIGAENIVNTNLNVEQDLEVGKSLVVFGEGGHSTLRPAFQVSENGIITVRDDLILIGYSYFNEMPDITDIFIYSGLDAPSGLDAYLDALNSDSPSSESDQAALSLPDKSIIVTTPDNIYIYDAYDNSGEEFAVLSLPAAGSLDDEATSDSDSDSPSSESDSDDPSESDSAAGSDQAAPSILEEYADTYGTITSYSIDETAGILAFATDTGFFVKQNDLSVRENIKTTDAIFSKLRVIQDANQKTGDIFVKQDIIFESNSKMSGLSGVEEVFVYDATLSGRVAPSGLVAYLDALNSDPAAGSDKAALPFPQKAIIALTEEFIYIYDAKDKELYARLDNNDDLLATLPLGATRPLVDIADLSLDTANTLNTIFSSIQSVKISSFGNLLVSGITFDGIATVVEITESGEILDVWVNDQEREDTLGVPYSAQEIISIDAGSDAIAIAVRTETGDEFVWMETRGFSLKDKLNAPKEVFTVLDTLQTPRIASVTDLSFIASTSISFYVATTSAPVMVVTSDKVSISSLDVNSLTINNVLNIIEGNIQLSDGFGIGTESNPRMLVLSNNMVGIGTSNPQSKLQVSGGGLCVGTDEYCEGYNEEGVIYSMATAMSEFDLAENYPTKDNTLVAGEIVMLGNGQGAFVSRASGNARVLGIISPKPGVLLGGFASEQYKDETQVPVALAGRVPVKVSLENGAINRGDYLTMSKKIPGAAAKLIGSGQVIGIALQSYNGSSLGKIYETQPNDQVMTFINLFYHYDDTSIVRVFDAKILDVQKQIDDLKIRVESLELWRKNNDEFE